MCKGLRCPKGLPKYCQDMKRLLFDSHAATFLFSPDKYPSSHNHGSEKCVPAGSSLPFKCSHSPLNQDYGRKGSICDHQALSPFKNAIPVAAFSLMSCCNMIGSPFKLAKPGAGLNGWWLRVSTHLKNMRKSNWKWCFQK